MTTPRVKGLKRDKLKIQDIEDGGWLSPDGIFYSYPFAQHEGGAINLVNDNYPNIKFELNKKDLLIRKGWILFTHSPGLGIMMNDYLIAVCKYRDKITPQQHRVIEKMQELSEEKYDQVIVSGFQEWDQVIASVDSRRKDCKG